MIEPFKIGAENYLSAMRVLAKELETLGHTPKRVKSLTRIARAVAVGAVMDVQNDMYATFDHAKIRLFDEEAT